MTREDNVFLAKRMMVDNIYRSAKLEGIAVTYAQTLDIVENIGVKLSLDEINDITNLKNSWKHILEHLDSELNLGTIKDIHGIIGRGIVPYYEVGEFRTGGVSIGGTNWRPEDPNTERLHEELMNIKRIENLEDRGIYLFCWVMRNQMFRDGNKRVANLVANFELIKNGAGIISVPEDRISEFKILLVNFYETNDISMIRNFIKDKCFYEDLEFLSRNEKRNKNNILHSNNPFSPDSIQKQLGKEALTVLEQIEQAKEQIPKCNAKAEAFNNYDER